MGGGGQKKRKRTKQKALIRIVRETLTLTSQQEIVLFVNMSHKIGSFILFSNSPVLKKRRAIQFLAAFVVRIDEKVPLQQV